MDPVQVAIMRVKAEIPRDILSQAFMPKRYDPTRRDRYFDNVSSTSIDEQIKLQVIEGRVSIDANLVGGTEMYLPIRLAELQTVDGWNMVYRFPREVTGGRRIISVHELNYGYTTGNWGGGGISPSNTNNLLSISGWPDVIAPFHTSQEGVYKEAFSLVDGLTVNYSTYDITANFRNMPGDPITLMFFVWCHYMSLVYRGDMVPYPDFIIQNEIDYQTRIYRLVLDSTKTRVQKIGACGAAFPTNAPMGAAFNFEHDRPINSSNDQISIHFQCMGAQYQDDILIYEFNRVVGLFNPGMATEAFVDAYSRDTNGQLVTTPTNRYHKKVPMDALVIFNNRGYPRINPNTYELEWWVSNEDYEQRIGIYQNQQQLRNQNG